jgi:mono/diheme cytochrome c family protein
LFFEHPGQEVVPASRANEPGAGKLFQEASRVMPGPLSGRALGRLALALPVVAVLSGCGSLDATPYPSDLTYPPRSDRIVVEPPKETPYTTDGPGDMERALARVGVAPDQGGVGGKSFDPRELPGPLRQEVENELAKVFSRPAQPTVKPYPDQDEAKEYVAKLKLDDATLAQGSIHYRRHCLHCHGLSGDGRGPTGPWLNPHPRDYRQGLFKFISTDIAVDGRKPRREDLLRTLRNGVDGTSMPSFALQPAEDLGQLVSYVIHLSLRGEIEYYVLRTLVENKGDVGSLEPDGTVAGTVAGLLDLFLKRWAQSDKSNQAPAYTFTDPQREESVRRGYALFTDTKGAASCIACHTDFGRQVPFRYDAWGTLVRPANLTADVYRGGRRPIDLYWRVRGGIPPSGMPQADLKPEQYWDLINFVQALPYPQMLPDDVRHKVYPTSEKAGTRTARLD